jgi:DNA-binding transcriptional regulator YdaS (Cro superfamily)
MIVGITAVMRAVNNNQSELARRLNITPQSVQSWVDKGSVPLGRVLEVENATGVPRHIISPDLYSEKEVDKEKVAA